MDDMKVNDFIDYYSNNTLSDCEFFSVMSSKKRSQPFSDYNGGLSSSDYPVPRIVEVFTNHSFSRGCVMDNKEFVFPQGYLVPKQKCSGHRQVQTVCSSQNDISQRLDSETQQVTSLPSSPRKSFRKRPMTQYDLDRKRNLANRQERRRMHRLNTALEKLRQAIPVHFQQQQPSRRPSKIKTLRLAINYIDTLGKLLNEHERWRDNRPYCGL